MVDAIKVIKEYYNSLTGKDKAEFQKEMGINSLYGINLMDIKVAEKYCKSHGIDLGDGSVWNLYNKGKADYAAALGDYNEAESIYNNLKGQTETAQTKYTTLVKNYRASNGEDAKISTAQDNQFRRESKYTTDLIKNTNDAEDRVDLALDARRMAVDEQRHGLMFGA